jgi:hypothetical protein
MQHRTPVPALYLPNSMGHCDLFIYGTSVLLAFPDICMKNPPGKKRWILAMISKSGVP